MDRSKWEYIQEHFDELCIFATQSFLDYVKQYNDAMKLLRFRTTGFSFIGKLQNNKAIHKNRKLKICSL